MENPIFNFFSLFQPVLGILKTRSKKPAKLSFIAKSEDVSSIKLFVSFTLYLAGGLLMDYGWHHHTIGFFLIGSLVLISSLAFVFWPFVSSKRELLLPEEQQEDEEYKRRLNNFTFLSMKM